MSNGVGGGRRWDHLISLYTQCLVLRVRGCGKSQKSPPWILGLFFMASQFPPFFTESFPGEQNCHI